jgi:hypothetical protein
VPAASTSQSHLGPRKGVESFQGEETEQEDFLVLAGQATSSRQFQKDGPCGFHCADRTAARYNAKPSQPTRYRDGLLPD